jgi:hypothetical protein
VNDKNDRGEWEDVQLLRLLEEMAEGQTGLEPNSLADQQDEESAALRQEYLEALALLPYELEPIAPPLELRERLIQQVAADPDRDPVGRRNEASPGPWRSGGWNRWALPLAATLAFLLVGATAWQVVRVGQQQDTIARLSQELESMRFEAAELARARGELVQVRSRLALVTSPASEFCALRPPEGSPAVNARGTLVMQMQKGDWFLRVEGLEPCSKGSQYQLWFLTEGSPVLGASFDVEAAGTPVELMASGGVPPGTNAVMITLAEDEDSGTPTKVPLLFGDERMRIL